MSEMLAPYPDPLDIIPRRAINGSPAATLSTDEGNRLAIATDGGIYIGGTHTLTAEPSTLMLSATNSYLGAVYVDAEPLGNFPFDVVSSDPRVTVSPPTATTPSAFLVQAEPSPSARADGSLLAVIYTATLTISSTTAHADPLDVLVEVY